MVEPLVPVPAPAKISPVGCSSTFIFIFLNLFEDPCSTDLVTDLNILFDLISFTDLFTKI